MSMQALRIARDARGLGPTQKLVLYVLADMANDAGECWPSMAAIVAASELSERAVHTAVKGARAAGYLLLEMGGGRGRTTLYRVVNPAGNAGKGAAGSGFSEAETPQQVQETPHVVQETPQEVQETPQEVHPEASRSLKKQKKDKIVARASQLPESWRPNADGEAFARERGLHLRNTYDEFRDYHRSKGSTFKDWDAAWRTWSRNAVKFGTKTPALRKPAQSNLSWMADPDAFERIIQ